MSRLIPKYKTMSLDEAIACKRDENAEKAYLEFFGVYINSEARPCQE